MSKTKADDVASYRIRWANVRHGNGHRERMCIAERRYRWFGWWPVDGAGWAFSEAMALADIDRDRLLRSPLPPPRTVAGGHDSDRAKIFVGHDVMDPEGLDRWRALARSTPGHDIMPINATSVCRLIELIDRLFAIVGKPPEAG